MARPTEFDYRLNIIFDKHNVYLRKFNLNLYKIYKDAEYNIAAKYYTVKTDQQVTYKINGKRIQTTQNYTDQNNVILYKEINELKRIFVCKSFIRKDSSLSYNKFSDIVNKADFITDSLFSILENNLKASYRAEIH